MLREDFDKTYMEVSHGSKGPSLEAAFFIAAAGNSPLWGHYLEHDGKVAGELYFPDGYKAGLFIGEKKEDGILVTHVVAEGQPQLVMAEPAI